MDKLYLWPSQSDVPHYNPEIDQDAPSLTPYLLDTTTALGAIIVVPGGGFVGKSAWEGEPVARAINALGFHAFVLDYRVFPYVTPAPQLDCKRALRFVRANAAQFQVKPTSIAILGFSAGGYYAAVVATDFDAGNLTSTDPIERVSCRPDAFIPCYAVTNLHMFRHAQITACLAGKMQLTNQELIALSPEYHIRPDTPPCFLWHTVADGMVPAENTLRFAQALSNHSIPYAMHLFPFGRHGLGIGDPENAPLVESWIPLLGKFLRQFGF